MTHKFISKTTNYTQRCIGKKQTDKNFCTLIQSILYHKNSIPYSQVLRVKRACSTIENFKLFCSELKQKFIEKGCKSDLLDKHISTVKKLDRNEMLKEKVREKPKQTRISLTLTYNCFCPNISKVIRKHWNLLAINESLKEIFNCQPIAAFRRNKNLKELIGSNKIEKNKVKKRQIQKLNA